MNIFIVYLFLCIGFLIDCFQCFNFIRNRNRGYGSSGVLIAPWIIFYYFPLFLTEKFFNKISIFTQYLWLDIFLFLIIHISLSFIIPALYIKYFSKNNY
jgi:hypothetical protein